MSSSCQHSRIAMTILPRHYIRGQQPHAQCPAGKHIPCTRDIECDMNNNSTATRSSRPNKLIRVRVFREHANTDRTRTRTDRVSRRRSKRCRSYAEETVRDSVRLRICFFILFYFFTCISENRSGLMFSKCLKLASFLGSHQLARCDIRPVVTEQPKRNMHARRP